MEPVVGEEKKKGNQVTYGISLGCAMYFLLVFIIIPWTFLVIGPGPTDGPLLGGREGERPSLDLYLFYSVPFILVFIGLVVLIYFITRHRKPAFAKSLLFTSLSVVGISTLLMSLLAFKIYS